MSYVANGSGYAVLKQEDCLPDDIAKKVYDYFNCDDIPDGCDMTLISDGTSDYDDRDVSQLLERLSPYIEEGRVDFIGESDDERWRYEFDAGSGHWDYKSGKIIYGDVTGFTEDENRYIASLLNNAGTDKAKAILDKYKDAFAA